MQPYEQNHTFGAGFARSQAEVDQGLRAFMLGVYNNMILGLAVTGLVALGLSMIAFTGDASQAAQAGGRALRLGGQFLTPTGALLFASPLKWVVMLAPLAFVFFFSFRFDRMSASTAMTTFLVFAAVMGLSLASIFAIYTGQSIVQVFFITAAAFGSLSLWGYTTKRSLSGMGSFLIMGLFGLIIASIVNIFLASSALIFAGLTAYDTQRLKDMFLYEVGGDAAAASKASVFGALSLYLNFINMFQLLLSLFGSRQE
jgi:FtsH-binding integral membrane protein